MLKRNRWLIAAALALAMALPMGAALAANGAPVAENLNLTTYRNVCGGGQLSAVDPEGDAVSFEITTQPGKGTVELAEDGRFVYTPDANRKGRDYFGYRAVDETGARSQEATVIISIEKQKTKTTYSDMTGHPSAYSATALAENGIFTGENIGGEWVFSPEQPVTRGEFLSMCMTLSGEKLLSAVAATGFADDEEIALEGMRRLEAFSKSIGMPTRLADIGIGDDRIDEMAKKAVMYGPIGKFKPLYEEDVAAILRLAL